MRTSTAALAAALTMITPAAASAADRHSHTPLAPAEHAALGASLGRQHSVRAQFHHAAAHGRLVRRHMRLAREVAQLRGRRLDERRERRRVEGWTNARLRLSLKLLGSKAGEIRAATAPVTAASTTAATSATTSSTATSTATTTSSTAASTATTTSTGGAGGQLASIRACESGGDYSASTGNGYYGAYQFTQQTWESVGGTGNPAAASAAEQDARAQQLMSQSGSSPWPVCGG